jgi:hypothetical protein
VSHSTAAASYPQPGLGDASCARPTARTEPWNRGKLVGQKAPLRLKGNLRDSIRLPAASSDRTPRGWATEDDRQSRIHRADRSTSLSGVAARSRFATVRVTCGPVPDVRLARVYGFRVRGLRAGGGPSYPAHEPNNEKNEQNCSEYATTDIHVILH